jgi:hypothetical protein
MSKSRDEGRDCAWLGHLPGACGRRSAPPAASLPTQATCRGRTSAGTRASFRRAICWAASSASLAAPVPSVAVDVAPLEAAPVLDVHVHRAPPDADQFRYQISRGPPGIRLLSRSWHRTQSPDQRLRGRLTCTTNKDDVGQIIVSRCAHASPSPCPCILPFRGVWGAGDSCADHVGWVAPLRSRRSPEPTADAFPQQPATGP